jgi:hypothetical protein
MSSLRFLQEDIMPPASLFFMALKFWAGRGRDPL